MPRRAVLRASASLGLGVALGRSANAHARPRTPVGGKLVFRIPWPIASLDPHRLDSALAAILGDALFDTLYARDETSAFVPLLAETDPEPDGKGLRVDLRAGLRTATGKSFEARDARDAIARARAAGARAWLADIPAPRVSGRSLLFPTRDASRLVRALASPLVAMVPSGFAPDAPDGTGPMRWSLRRDGVVLLRNPLAARGPSYLDEVEVRAAPDLAASLRSFESGIDDLGWLGSGIIQPRSGSRPFDFGAVAWVVLFTGRDAGRWDAPGVAQQLCDGIPPSRLAPFALGPAWTTAPQPGWGGAPAAILVRDDAPWLVELARTIAVTLDRPGSDVTARPVPAAELAQRRASRQYALALDVVRPLDRGSLGALVALATADGAARATDVVQHPPRLGDAPARTMTRTLRCGVVGEVRVQGGRAADVALAASSNAPGVDLGASTRLRAK